MIHRRTKTWIVLLLCLAVAGVVLILYHTRNGPGITGDSVHYVMGAQNLIQGRGYARTGGGGEAIPITGFPPGYSLSLVVVDLLSIDVNNGARIFNAVLFGVNIFLAGLIIYRYSKSIWASFLGGSFILLSENLIHIHSWVMSEPVFLALSLFAILVLMQYFNTHRRRYLVSAALLLSASVLTRYVGISLMGAACLAILAFGRRKWTVRVIDLAIFGGLAILPIVAWFVRNASVTDTLTNRVLLYHPLSREILEIFLGTMNAWFFPLSLGVSKYIRAVFSFLLTVMIPAVFVVQAWKARRRNYGSGAQSDPYLPWLLILYLPLYLFALYANSTFFDAATTPFGASRYLDPAFVAMVLLLLCAAWRIWSKLDVGSFFRRALQLLPVFFLLLYCIRAFQYVNNPGQDFRYTDIRKQMPELISLLAALDPDRVLVSNDIELLFALSNRTAYAFPIYYDLYQKRYRDDFEDQIAFTESKLEQGALIVYFTPLDETAWKILDRLHVESIMTYDGANVYQQNE